MNEQTESFYRALARAFGGAILFAFPILMTMETWWLGFYLQRERIGLFLLLALPLLFGLGLVSGFRFSSSWFEEVIDAFVAYAVGFATVGLFLWLFGVIDWQMPLSLILGQVGFLAVPCAFGALVASEQLSEPSRSNRRRKEKTQGHYYAELGIMLAGALYGAFTVSPTVEMQLIAYKATPWLLLGLILISLCLMHGFVYGMSFRGEEKTRSPASFLQLFSQYTVVGYAIALGVSTYVLWTFERLQGLGFGTAVAVIVVLAFPAAVGAAASRLII